MAHRIILTAKQRKKLFDLPSCDEMLLKHYILSDEDLAHIHRKRKPHNRLGFAMQLCALRYPGRYISKDEILPPKMLAFIGTQLGIDESVIEDYAKRKPTRYDHVILLQDSYGFQPFGNNGDLIIWIEQAAEHAKSNVELAEMFLRKCREQKIIVPAISTIERLCSESMVKAERNITRRIVSRLDERMKKNLHAMLEETAEGWLSTFVWLRKGEPGSNSADANRLMDRLEYLKELQIPKSALENIPTHRVVWLRQQGERYYADGLRELNEERRLSILAVCAVEWEAMLTDALIETHDRIIGKIYNDARRTCEMQMVEKKSIMKDTLKSFVVLGKGLLDAYEQNKSAAKVVALHPNGWEGVETLIATANGLTNTVSADPLDFVLGGYARLRRYTQRVLENIALEGNQAASSLLEAIGHLKSLNQEPDKPSKKQYRSSLPITFARSKWRSLLAKNTDRKLWETAVLFAIRDALRSGDLWVRDSRRYQNIGQAMISAQEISECTTLPVPLCAGQWLDERKATLDRCMKTISLMSNQDGLPNSVIENGILHVDRLERSVPDGAEELTLELYSQLPLIRITDILMEVDEDIGFTDAFTHLHTGSPCRDKVGLLNVLLAEGVNLGLKKMASSSSSHTSFWPLMRISQWYIHNNAYQDALAMIVESQANLPLSSILGDGNTSSSDAQFFPAGGTGEAMNLVNAKYGNTPGLKAYTHVSDQYAPYAIQTIPATAHEAPYIIDGLTMNNTGQRIKEHYTDTGGFTDHVFAMCSLLGYEFAPRIRNLPSLRLYAFDKADVPDVLASLVAAKAKVDLIERQWPDVVRLVASIITHRIVPSHILRQLASFPRQNELAVALREIGRIERTIFILKWITSIDLQRRAQMGLNKGEAHHALKRALNFNRRGEIRDRTSENQHYRMAGLNLLAAIIIYWNTKHLGHVIHDVKQQGRTIPEGLLSHISPLGWEHIILAGEYKWKNH